MPKSPARHHRAAVQSNEVYPTPLTSPRLSCFGAASDKRFTLCVIGATTRLAEDPLDIYLYLTLPEWTAAWTTGGRIPIALASTYLSHKREGTLTPDETRIDNLNVDIRRLKNPDALPQQFRNCVFIGNAFQGPDFPLVVGDRYREDGLILSFSTERSWLIARKLGKNSCVRISNVNRLKAIIDEQIGVKGEMGPCAYTNDHDRNHYLKSTADFWQCEFRMFWRGTERVEVVLPPGVAETVHLRR